VYTTGYKHRCTLQDTNTDVHYRIQIKIIARKCGAEERIHFAKPDVGSCKHSNELWGSLKHRNFFIGGVAFIF
jgi:hypothetical protein